MAIGRAKEDPKEKMDRGLEPYMLLPSSFRIEIWGKPRGQLGPWPVGLNSKRIIGLFFEGGGLPLI